MNPEEIYIGSYIIRRLDDESLWIVDVETGEGMETSEEKLSEWIAEYWKREF